MGGFFGTVSKAECVTDLFYGTDYNSHLGTKRGGLATYAQGEGFMRSIHNLESSYFRTKFESELPKFKGSSGIGIISDTDPQPIVINSHLGKFAIVTVAKINNITELERDLLAANMHFSEMSLGSFCGYIMDFLFHAMKGKNVEEVRFMSGYKMGQKDDSEVDCACGIPDSGVGMALGYAEGKGIPYHRAIAKYTPTWPRSFTPANQEMRSLVAKMKLIPNRAMLEGKRVLFCDDSIVRGTQLRDNVKILFDYGAKEVHMRIACPPLIYGCPFIGFTSSKSDLELITRRMIKEIEGDENKNLENMQRQIRRSIRRWCK